MTLLKTALKNLRKNLVMNIICLLQLTAVFLITAVMVSTMCIRYRTYTPLKNFLESKGFYSIYFEPFFGAIKPGGDFNNDAVFSVDELSEYMNADKVVIIRRNPMVYNGETAGTFFYDREIAERYTPALERGRWVSPDANELEIVITDGLFGLDVGDEAEAEILQYHQIPAQVKVRVVGVLEDTSKILYDFSRGENGDDSYRCLYRTRNDISMPVVLASTDAMQRLYPQAYELYIHSVFFMYDDITDEELKQEMSTAGQMNARITLRLEDINRNSREYLKNELLKQLPVAVILLILVIISSISVSAIAARRRLRDYAKYYVLGLRWRQCALVNLYQALVIGSAALVIACAGLIAVGAAGFSDMFMIIWNAPLFLSLLGVLALYLAFSMIMPVLMLRSTTPKALLQAE